METYRYLIENNPSRYLQQGVAPRGGHRLSKIFNFFIHISSCEQGRQKYKKYKNWLQN